MALFHPPSQSNSLLVSLAPALIRKRANRRYAVLASLARLTRELYARQAKSASRQAREDDAAAAAAAEEEEEVVVVEEQVVVVEEQVVVVEEQAGGLLRGDLAFDVITSESVWRYILEFM